MTPAGLRVLETASRLFYEQGIRAVGVEAVADESGVTKKTLYDRFGSKDDLVLAYLRARDSLWRTTLVDHVNDHAGTPQEKLLATFGALREWTRTRNARGCAFVNASVELPGDHPGQQLAREQKSWMLAYLGDLAAQAGVPDPDALSRELLILHEGASVTDAMGSVDEAARRAERMARVLIAAALAAGAGT